ncbi:MAG: GNAT family N-acetyltransferase [Candidatus Nanoarchaeia archaeon]|nr:GNAT family N-acetyltransferase [Candidatus Nanoarchaeia archaeon]
MTIIRGDGFILRPLKISDAKGYWETMQDKETIKGLMSVPHSLSEAKKEIKEDIKEMKEKGSEYFTIEVNRKYAGNVILQYQNWDKTSEDGRIHMWLHPDFRGRGLATKAIKKLIGYGFKKGFKRIYAQCKASNKAVISINKKLGFKKVKTHMVEGVKKILWVKVK